MLDRLNAELIGTGSIIFTVYTVTSRSVLFCSQMSFLVFLRIDISFFSNMITGPETQKTSEKQIFWKWIVLFTTLKNNNWRQHTSGTQKQGLIRCLPSDALTIHTVSKIPILACGFRTLKKWLSRFNIRRHLENRLHGQVARSKPLQHTCIKICHLQHFRANLWKSQKCRSSKTASSPEKRKSFTHNYH